MLVSCFRVLFLCFSYVYRFLLCFYVGACCLSCVVYNIISLRVNYADMYFSLDVICFSILFFFFKQKTAYEMLISDWSSDVCSSDLMLVGFTSVASAQAPLPVPNAFLAGVPQELGNPGGSAPGSNDFSCKPTAEHPNPVVLVHGTGGNRQTNWATYAPLLANEGYCVFALTYGNFPEQPWPLSAIGGMQEIPSSAAQLSNFVDQVLDATGATSVDLVGHSQGTIINGYYAKFLGGADKVDNIVSVASLWKGTLEIGRASGRERVCQYV